MSIHFQCPSCGHGYAVRRAFAGTRWACKQCGGEMLIPQEAAAIRPTEPSPAQSSANEGHWAGQFHPCGLPARHYRIQDKAEFDHPTIAEGAVNDDHSPDSRSYQDRLRAWEQGDMDSENRRRQNRGR